MSNPIYNPYGVKPGQQWQDCDKRAGYRVVTVERVEGEYAYVKFVHTTRVSLSRFRPNSTGYKLVRDVK